MRHALRSACVKLLVVSSNLCVVYAPNGPEQVYGTSSALDDEMSDLRLADLAVPMPRCFIPLMCSFLQSCST